MDDLDRAAMRVVNGDGMDAAANDAIGTQRTGLRSTLYDALLANPDVAARATRLGRETGLPPDLVERNLPEVERNARLGQLDDLPRKNPVLAAWLADPVNAKLAHDDAENLSGIEQAFTALKKTGKAAVSGLRSASAGAVGLARVPFDLINAVEQPLVDSGARESVPFKRTAKWLADWQNEIAGRAKAEMPKADGNLGAGYYSGIASLSRNLTALPMAFLPGGQKATLSAMVAPVGGEAYGEARDQHLPMPNALTYAGSQAAIEYATERLPLTKLLGDLKAGTPFFKTLVRNAALEVPGEQLATILQDLNEWAVLPENQDKPFSEYLKERPDAAAQTLIATLVGTGGQVTVMEGVSRAVGYAENRAMKAQQAEQGAAFVENLNKLAAADKLLQRDPESFQSFVAAAAEDGPVDTVFLDGKFLLQSGMAPRLAEMSPAVREQLDRAILTGGSIQIPVDEYAARIAPTEEAAALVEHLRTEPDGFSLAEARTFMEGQADELQAQVETALAESEQADTFRASQDAVKADLLEQLNAANRFTPQVNEAYASLVSSYTAVRAAQLGVTPEEFHKTRGMGVRAETVDGLRFDQDGKLVTDTPAFRNWFGDSKVVDAQGKPLVVYHGGLKFDAFMDSPEAGAHYASDDVGVAEGYASQYSETKSEIKPLYIRMANPLDLRDEAAFKEWTGIDPDDSGSFSDWGRKAFMAQSTSAMRSGGGVVKKAKAAGYDGVIFYDTDVQNRAYHTSYAFFDPRQAKSGSADEARLNGYAVREDQNRGTFDPNNPNILLQSNNGRSDSTAGNAGTAGEVVLGTVAGGNARAGWADATRIRGTDGQPRTIHRGAALPLDPEHFQLGALGTATGRPSAGLGVWFTIDPREADTYGDREDFHLDIRNPLVVKVEDLPGFETVEDAHAWRESKRAEGYDGIVVTAKHLGGRTHIIAFEPEQVVYPPPKAGEFYQSSSQTDTAQFKAWAEGAPVIEADEMQDYEGGPAVFRLFHGTTGDFTVFDRERANPESDLGAGFYFTNNPDDVSANYAGEGPDLTQRIQLLAERIAGETDRDYSDPEVIAEAKERLAVEHGGMAMPVFVKVSNPLVIGGENETRLTYEQEYDEETDEYGDETGTLVDFIMALRNVADRYNDGSVDDAIDAMLERGMDGDIRASDVMEALRNSEEFTYYTDDEGNLVNNEIVRQAFEEAGFDGFVDYTVNQKFGTERDVGKAMAGMHEDTVHVVVFEPTQIKSAVGNSGAFDPNNPDILFQPDGATQAPRGAFSPETNLVTLLKNADLSTFLHESAHYFFENDIRLAAELVAEARQFGYDTLKPGEQQIVDDVSKLLSWHGIDGDIEAQLRTWYTMDFEEQRTHHERTAESFEAYLFSGRAPNLELQPIFQRFRAWMVNIYKSLKDFLTRNPEAGKLNDEVRAVFDRMIATQEQIAVAEKARSLVPLFNAPEQSGMTPDEFAAYQALGIDATNDAIEELQAKAARDMQWLHNARGREVRRLKRESRALRDEAMIEARREVMSQPVYRAWDFLTRKIEAADALPPLDRKSDPDVLDPALDSLFVAIAKLGGVRKDQVISEWGVDPKDTPKSGLFGKPVWRLKDGLTLDGMAEALAEHGYLALDENGKYELNDLADRFLAELGGTPQYSVAHEYDGARPGEQVANPGGLGAGRLDLGALAAMGADDAVVQRLKDARMTAKDGLHPDLVAELFGFSSGDEMVQALAVADKPKDAINALADRLMLERHGELATPEAIEAAADAAIHNRVMARMLATEYNALAAAVGKPKLLAEAARAFAESAIAGLKVRDIQPRQYAAAAERAARAADKAMRAADTATAADEKRNQVLQHTLTRAAYDAKDEVDAGVRYLRKFDKRSKTIDPEYQDQIEALLERFEFRPASLKAIDKRASFAQWLAAQREAGLEPDVPAGLETEANRTHYKNLTVEEFRGLVDTVKQIEHLGRLKHKLLTAQDQRAFTAIVDEVAASIVEHGGKPRDVELEGTKPLKAFAAGFLAEHRKLASLVRQMDGGQDNGPLWRVLVRTMNERSVMETVMNEQATERLAALYKPMLALKGGLNGDKRFIPAINASLTRGGRLAVALNWGNATNRQRILDGDGWSEHQVEAILSTLTREEWAFVQGAWDMLESYWPEIAAKEKRVTGREPEKVERLPFTRMVDGETISLTGGYYPIKYDAERSDRAEKIEAAEIADEMKRGALSRSTTRRGHTKARVEGVKRPVRKSLDVMTQHVAQVTHDLAWHEWLVDASRILNAGPITDAVRDHYGPEVLRTMRDALNGIAVGDVQRQTRLDAALLYLRANVSRATMGFSLTTALLQPFGLTQSMVRIGTRHVLRGMGRWAGDAARMQSSMTWITEKSEFMRLRNKTFNRELHEIKGRVNHGHSTTRQVYDAALFMLMQKMQLIADIPTWIGAFEKATAEGHDEQTAVALADQAVLDAQGGGQTKDLSEVQRKHPLMTMFYSYFNATLNLAAESTAKTSFREPLAVAGWLSDMALLAVVPALAPALVLMMLRGEDCEDIEECAGKLARDQAGFAMNMLVGVRELSGIVAGYDYAGPPVGRVANELKRAGTQAAQGEADEAAAMSAVSLAGVAFGIPTTQIIRSWRGWNAWVDDEAPATAILFGPPPKE